jgi:hypothetical protein
MYFTLQVKGTDFTSNHEMIEVVTFSRPSAPVPNLLLFN